MHAGFGKGFCDQDGGRAMAATNVGDLAAIADLFATAPPVWAQGELSSELWLNWNQGEAELDIELSLLDTVISDRDGSWALPLDGLSLQAKLLERRNRWTIYGADLSAASDGVEVTIGRKTGIIGRSIGARSTYSGLACNDIRGFHGVL